MKTRGNDLTVESSSPGTERSKFHHAENFGGNPTWQREGSKREPIAVSSRLDLRCDDSVWLFLHSLIVGLWNACSE